MTLKKFYRKLFNFSLIPIVFKNWHEIMTYALCHFLMKPAEITKLVVELRRGQRIKIKSLLDLGSVIEIFHEQTYTRKYFQIPEDATVIDIGASIGDFSIFCCTTFSNCTCYSYEPSIEAFELSKENIRLNKLDEKIHPFQLAISDQRGTAEIGSQVFSAITLDDIFAQNRIQKCHLMKMDIEGAEYKILLNAPKEVFDRIEALALEYHLYEGDEAFIRLRDFLSNHFDRVVATPANANRVGYLYAYKSRQ